MTIGEQQGDAYQQERKEVHVAEADRIQSTSSGQHMLGSLILQLLEQGGINAVKQYTDCQSANGQ
jgi:hypothetical protein